MTATSAVLDPAADLIEDLPSCLTTVKHLHIIADRYDRPVVQLGDYFYVVLEKPGRVPMAYVAPVAEAAGLSSADLTCEAVA